MQHAIVPLHFEPRGGLAATFPAGAAGFSPVFSSSPEVSAAQSPLAWALRSPCIRTKSITPMKYIASHKVLIPIVATAAFAISMSSCRRDNGMTDDTVPDTTTTPDTTRITPDTTWTTPETTTRETRSTETRTEQQTTPGTTVEPRFDPNTGTVPAPGPGGPGTGSAPGSPSGSGSILPDEQEPE